MRAYVCDKCGRKITKKAAIKDKACIINFPMPHKQEENKDQTMWGGFRLKLLSNCWSDLCTTCIQELIKENINRK